MKTSTFEKELEKQIRLEVRKILNIAISTTTEFKNGRWVVTIDVTEAENKLTKLALDCY